MTAEELGELETVLGHHFEKPERLERALTHRSHRQNSAGIDNERLEFLGDRVLGLVARDVYKRQACLLALHARSFRAALSARRIYEKGDAERGGSRATASGGIP